MQDRISGDVRPIMFEVFEKLIPVQFLNRPIPIFLPSSLSEK
jgi:hypothetical protein